MSNFFKDSLLDLLPLSSLTFESFINLAIKIVLDARDKVAKIGAHRIYLILQDWSAGREGISKVWDSLSAEVCLVAGKYVFNSHLL